MESQHVNDVQEQNAGSSRRAKQRRKIIPKIESSMMKDEEILSLSMELLECRRVAKDLTERMMIIERSHFTTNADAQEEISALKREKVNIETELGRQQSWFQEELDKKDSDVRVIVDYELRLEECAQGLGWRGLDWRGHW